MKKIPFRVLFRNFLIELALYGILVVAYFLIVLRWLGQPLVDVFHDNLPLYSGGALVLIVIQGVALEAVTAFLVERLGLERLE
jgi:hypothetical protein